LSYKLATSHANDLGALYFGKLKPHNFNSILYQLRLV